MDGILPLWKEKGMTSHDCVFKLRKILQTKKIGHAGTLDPDVEGILLICIGKATRVSEYLMDAGKTYAGKITLGTATTTEDASGEIVAKKPVINNLDLKIIDQTMAKFIGNITQIPPMYSAVKVKGKKLYEYARNGESVERPIRQAKIYRLNRTDTPYLNQANQTLSWSFIVDCGKGTYIRTLAVDIGEALGYPAHMSDLTRLASGGFTEEQSLTLADVAEKMENGTIGAHLFPIELAVKDFPRINLTPELAEKVKNGALLPRAIWDEWNLTELESCALFYENLLISIYQVHPSKPDFLKPVKVFRNE